MYNVLRVAASIVATITLLTLGVPAKAQTAPASAVCNASECSVTIASSQLQNLSQLKDAISAYDAGGSYVAEVTAIEADATQYIDEARG